LALNALNNFKNAAKEYDLGNNSKYRVQEQNDDKWLKSLQELADKEEGIEQSVTSSMAGSIMGSILNRPFSSSINDEEVRQVQPTRSSMS
jgi:hypothetical protein